MKTRNCACARLGSGETALYGGTSSLIIQQVRQNIQRVAPTGSRVLITGNPGTGKNIAARMLHNQSKRADKNYVVLNCAILSPDRIELELFGAEGAIGRKEGVLEQANGGTLFLDEVADMPLETQAKIVRVLQDQHFTRLGGTDRIDVDVRVIAATNQNLPDADAPRKRNSAKTFTTRLNVVPINMPCAAGTAGRYSFAGAGYFARWITGRPGCREYADRALPAPDAMALMQSYDWPGNVRQLRNVIEWLLIMAAGEANVRRSSPTCCRPI